MFPTITPQQIIATKPKELSALDKGHYPLKVLAKDSIQKRTYLTPSLKRDSLLITANIQPFSILLSKNLWFDDEMARISIFKGRETRLNKAIFWIVAQKAPLTVYDIWRVLRSQRDFAYVRYNIVNRRVRMLTQQGFIEKVGEKRTKTGLLASLYELTARAYLAYLLEKVDFDDFVKKAPYESILTAISAIIFMG